MTPVLQPTSSYESPGSATDGGTVAASKLDFVRAMRNVVSGVAIITTFYESQLWGMTVSAFTTVCAEPPTLMVCVNTRTVLAAVLQLAERQVDAEGGQPQSREVRRHETRSATQVRDGAAPALPHGFRERGQQRA